MKWSAKEVDRLMLEMSSQAKASAWDDRQAPERSRILTEIMKRYGWVRRDQHPAEVCDAAVAIAFHAPSLGIEGHVLRLQVLGCLFAETQLLSINNQTMTMTKRRWFGLAPNRSAAMPSPDSLSNGRFLREHFTRILDKALLELNHPIVFGTAGPTLKHGRAVYPDLCCPHDLLWLRNTVGRVGPDSSVQHL